MVKNTRKRRNTNLKLVLQDALLIRNKYFNVKSTKNEIVKILCEQYNISDSTLKKICYNKY